MPHVHFLAAWQSNDIETIKSIVAKDIKTNIVYQDGTEKSLSYDEFVGLLKKRLDAVDLNDREWQFDVLYKTERCSANIVVIKVATGDLKFTQSPTGALCIFTFDTVVDKRQLVRAYIELDVTNK